MVLRRRVVVVMAILLAIPAALFAFRHALLRAVGEFLVVSDPLRPADIIFVANGDADRRPLAAAALYRRQLAPRVVVARSEARPTVKAGLSPLSSDVTLAMLRRSGIPEEAIVEIPGPGVTSTRDEAVVLRQWMKQHRVRSAILVVGLFQSRRARGIFAKVLLPGEIEWMIVPTQGSRPRERWYADENSFIQVFEEYLKLAYYAWRY